MSYTKTILILLLISFFGFLVVNWSNPIRIEGDGVFYYSWLRSAVFDADFNFLNELERFSAYDVGSQVMLASDLRTPLGKIPNPYAYGTAVLWAPLYLLAHLVTWLLQLTVNGYSYLYVWFVNLASWLFGSVAFLLLYINLKKFFSDTVSFWSSLGIYLATPWVYYQFFEPSMSHMASLLMVSIFLHLVIKIHQKKYVNSLFFMAVVFLMIATRWQNMLFGVAYLPILWSYRDNIKQLVKSVLMSLVPVVLFWLTQAMIWQHLYGRYLLIPQGSHFVRSKFHVFYILFSSNRGLLLWSPIIIIAVLGAYYLWRKSKFLFFIFISAFVMQWLLNGSINDLGGGDAYGSRRFIETLPFLVLALAAFWDKIRLKTLMPILTIVLIVLNIILVDRYRKGVVPHHGEFDISDVLGI
jgi:hypothetical protein